MARKALIVKTQKLKRKQLNAHAQGRKMKKSTRVYNRCKLCGRPRGYLRYFDVCRICFRELASQGEIMGIKKSSW